METSIKNGKEPAFSSNIDEGLTKREYFAGLAIQGLLASMTEKAAGGNWGGEEDATAAAAVRMADELLKALEAKL